MVAGDVCKGRGSEIEGERGLVLSVFVVVVTTVWVGDMRDIMLMFDKEGGVIFGHDVLEMCMYC